MVISGWLITHIESHDREFGIGVVYNCFEFSSLLFGRQGYFAVLL